MEFCLEAKEITKTFGGVKALNKVNFRLKEGEVHCLVGENGAGKSTHSKAITRTIKLTSGNYKFGYKTDNFEKPGDA